MDSPERVIFWCVVGGALLHLLLLVVSIANPARRFWPPPAGPSWRRTVARVLGPVGPLSVLGMLALGALDWNTAFWPDPSRFAVGGLLFVAGNGFALWGAVGLGLEASRGFGGPLRIHGAYRYSRNPQYVGTVIGFLGWGLLCNSTLTLAALAAWSAWYLLAPFAEEPWCREQLGAPYDLYAESVRRYL